MLYEARHLRRTYRRGESRIRAVDGIDLAIARGEHIAVVGPSGSGKSTLLHILGLLDGDHDGRLLFDGQDTSRMNATQRALLRLKDIGIVYQGFHLLSALDVRDNVALPHWRLHGKRRRAVEKAEKALCALDLEHRLRHRVSRLSAGEIQRVAIARALINEPRVVLADEPTGNLDSANTDNILAVLSRIPRQQRTLVVITHDPAVQAAAQRVIHLRYGKIRPPERETRTGP